ncbi:hypothetical protein J3459_012480 [Metarhizium acridum]|uniref:uncharacterized protein n=1 Tax=Metarhizium acridum TaxID=92637 RepID=UPI001C6C0B47|nr:hypothetical protein J3458_012293 [Metarhizium acridum]KAG8417274.1 hypothetical protein J3459_012480 [Metarhizium acridum]
MAAFGGRLEYQSVQHIRGIMFRIGDGGNIWGLDFYFTDEQQAIRLGVDGVSSEEKFHFIMDPGGEHIARIVALYPINGGLRGVKVTPFAPCHRYSRMSS